LVYKPTIPRVPRKVSSFTNDEGYLTSADIEGKADKATTYTKTEVNTLLAEIDDDTISLEELWDIVKADIGN